MDRLTPVVGVEFELNRGYGIGPGGWHKDLGTAAAKALLAVWGEG